MQEPAETDVKAVDPQRARWQRIARDLVIGTMTYDAVEAVVAIAWGSSRTASLWWLGLDSVIECAAAGAVLWRLAVRRAQGRPRRWSIRRRVRRSVGATFVVSAIYVVFEAGRLLWAGEHPKRVW